MIIKTKVKEFSAIQHLHTRNTEIFLENMNIPYTNLPFRELIVNGKELQKGSWIVIINGIPNIFSHATFKELFTETR